MKLKNKFLTLVIILSTGFYSLIAQGNYSIDNSGSKIIVEGTSNLHDWELVAQNLSSELDLIEGEKTVSDIRNVSFTMKAENLQSDNSIMNKKTQNALKTNKYNTIQFSPTNIVNIKSSGNNFTGIARGELKIAGKQRPVEVNFKGRKTGKSITIMGEKELKMSDYGIDPPTAMLGTLKTGDLVSVRFVLEYTDEQYTENR